MKRETVMKACVLAMGGLAAFSALADEQARAVAEAFNRFADYSLSQNHAPGWLRRSGVKASPLDDGLGWTAKTIQPLARDDDETLYCQGRLARKGEDVTANLGAGYRWLPEERDWLFGVEGHYDRARDAGHERVGLGGLALGRYSTFRAHWYKAVGGEGTPARKPLDGYDLELEAPLPFLPPSTRLSLKRQEWGKDDPAHGEEWRTALRVRANDRLNLDLGVADGSRKDPRLFLTLSYSFDRRPKAKRSPAKQLAPKQAFAAYDLDMHIR